MAASAPRTRLETARRRDAARQLAASDLDEGLRRDRVIERVQRTVRHLMSPGERLLAVSTFTGSPTADRRGWAVTTDALIVGDFARTQVTRFPMDRLRDATLGLTGQSYTLSVVVAGEPAVRLDAEFASDDLDAARALLTRLDPDAWTPPAGRA